MKHRKGPSHWPPAGFSLIEMLVAVLLAVNVIALLGCAVERVRNGSRTQETNNLKQIGLAAHGYHDAFKKLPYNRTSETYLETDVQHGGTANVGGCRVATGADKSEFRQDNRDSPTSGWGSPFPQGGLFAMADGTVRLFPYARNLAPFLDPDDGAPVTLPD